MQKTNHVSLTDDRLILELGGIERVPMQELVELGAIAAGEASRLGDVAAGHLQQADQIVELELPPGIGKGTTSSTRSLMASCKTLAWICGPALKATACSTTL